MVRTTTRTSSRRQHAIRNGYRSGLEEEVGADLAERGVEFEFEQLVVRYEVPVRRARYTPDFRLLRTGILVETKGRFTAADRRKHLQVRESNPDLDIRFVFQNPNAKLYKGSKTTYAQWCDRHGFIWAAKRIPEEWCC